MLHAQSGRSLVRSAAAGGLFVVAVSCAPAAQLEMFHRGHINLASTTTDQHGQTFSVTGVSGISMVPDARPDDPSRFLAVMDNSNKVLRIAASFAADGSFATAQITGAVTLAETWDFEGIVATDSTRGTVLLAEESTPSIREYRLSDGALVRVLPAPAVYAARRPNYGFESLGGQLVASGPATLGATLWTCNEEALTVDGPLSTSSTGTVVRLLRWTISGGTAVAGPQVAYVTEPVHGGFISGSRSGVSDLVMLPDGRVLALERSFAFSAQGFFRTRVFELAFDGATDVSSMPGLINQAYTPISTANGTKRQLWAGDLQNLEGLTMGPMLPDRSWSLVGVVDDGDPISVNRLVAFRVTGVKDVPIRSWPGRWP